jgi:hypothetical protein
MQPAALQRGDWQAAVVPHVQVQLQAKEDVNRPTQESTRKKRTVAFV